jgi:hypothetical protein
MPKYEHIVVVAITCKAADLNPLLAGSYSGVDAIDDEVADGARACGMTEMQVLSRPCPNMSILSSSRSPARLPTSTRPRGGEWLAATRRGSVPASLSSIVPSTIVLAILAIPPLLAGSYSGVDAIDDEVAAIVVEIASRVSKPREGRARKAPEQATAMVFPRPV